MTNADFKEFVDAGGYADARHWEGLTFVRNGVELPFEQAMAQLVDSTGRPGPASWELGDYPEGQGGYPVTGVSRYEAAAYARFRGKQLPTVYHWAKAGRTDWDAGSSLVGSSLPLSNFGTTGPVAVGSRQDIGRSGPMTCTATCASGSRTVAARSAAGCSAAASRIPRTRSARDPDRSVHAVCRRRFQAHAHERQRGGRGRRARAGRPPAGACDEHLPRVRRSL